MSKLIPSISGIACVLWVAVWAWGLSDKQSDQSSKHIASPSLRISDADSVFSTDQVFSFFLSDDKPVIPAESLNMLKGIARYLNVQPEKTLTLTGSYLPLPSERNQTPHPNLGIARANAIKQVLVGEGADPDQILTAAQEVQNHLMLEGRLLSGVEFDFNEAIAVEAKEVAEVNNTVPETKEKPTSTTKKGVGKAAVVFEYEYKDFTLAAKNRTDLDELRQLIEENPSFRLIISGFSSKDEEKEVANLAERRSLAVRRYLVDTGVRRRNIIVESHPGTVKDESMRRVEISIVK